MSDETKLSAVLELKDKFSATISNAKAGLKSMQNTAKSFGKQMTDASRGVEKFKREADGIKKEYSTRLRLRDRATAQLNKFKADFAAVNGKIATATVRIRQIGGEKLSKLGNSAAGTMLGTSVQMAAGVGVGMTAIDGINTYKDFEAQMRRVQGISGATTEQLAQLSKAARDAAASSQFNPTESGKALEYMAMAGWKTEESIAALPGVLNLAAASGEDLAQVSDILTDSMTAFHMSASQAGEFADVLATAATNSNTNVGKMGYTFKYVAPVAGALGYSVQDVALGIGAMADAGIKGEQAGTSLRSILNNMIAPTSTSSKAMEALGLSMKDANGNMKPFRTVLTDLRKAFNGLTKDQKAQYASMLAGQEGMSGLLAIVDKDETGFNKLADAIDKANGKSKEMSKIMNDNLAGDLKEFGSQWDEFMLTLFYGSGSNGPGSQLRNIVKEAKSVLKEFTDGIKNEGFSNAIFSGVKRIVKDTLKAVYEFDGSLGSYIATGSTIAAFYKIYKIGTKIRDLFKGKKKGAGVSGTDSAIGEMTVNAGVVYLNGKTGVGDVPTGGSTKNAPAKGGVKKVPSMGGKGMKALGIFNKVAAPLAALEGAYRIYNAEDGKKAQTTANVAGGLTGMWAGGKAGAAIGGAIGSAFGGVGAVPGAAIGGAIGSIGGYIGGEALTDLVDWGALVDGATTAFDGVKETAGQTWEELKSSAKNGIAGVVGIAAPLFDTIAPYWQSGVETLSVVWDSIGSAASIAWDTVSSCASTAWDSVVETFSPAASWFDSVVWQPISSAVSSVGSAITSAFNGALSAVKGAWQGVASWFEANVVAPVKRTISSIGSGISGAWEGAKARGMSVLGWGHNATGSVHWKGGLTEINERGGEIIDLPRGTRIYPYATTERIIKSELTRNKENVTPVMMTNTNTDITNISNVNSNTNTHNLYNNVRNATSNRPEYSNVNAPVSNRPDYSTAVSNGIQQFDNSTFNRTNNSQTLNNAISDYGDEATSTSFNTFNYQPLPSEPVVQEIAPNVAIPTPKATPNVKYGDTKVDIHIDSLVVREEADVDKIGNSILRAFLAAKTNYGGAY